MISFNLSSLRQILWIAAVLLSLAHTARAEERPLCNRPFASSYTPLHIFVVQDIFSPEFMTYRTIANQLLQASALDLLSVIGPAYTSVSIDFIQQNSGCDLRALIYDISQNSPGISIIVSQKVVREDDQVLVQTYLQTSAIADAGNFSLVNLTLKGSAAGIQATVIPPTVVFAPRSFSFNEMRKVAADLDHTNTLFPEPNIYASGELLSSAESSSVSFVAAERRPDSWTKVQFASTGEAKIGWLRTDATAGQLLHRILPELDFVEALAAYLSSRERPEDIELQTAAIKTVRRYLRGIQDREEAATPLNVAAAIEGSLWLNNPNKVPDPTPSLLTATEREPGDAELRALLAMVRMRGCCIDASGAWQLPPNASHAENWFETLDASFTDLKAAVAANPGSPSALYNLRAFYQQLLAIPEQFRPAIKQGRLIASDAAKNAVSNRDLSARIAQLNALAAVLEGGLDASPECDDIDCAPRRFVNLEEQKARAEVNKAIKLYLEKGPQAFASMNDSLNFREDNSNLFVVGKEADGIARVVVQREARLIGVDVADIRDAGSNPVGLHILARARPTGAWVPFNWFDVRTGTVKPKSLWVVSYGDYIFGSAAIP